MTTFEQRQQRRKQPGKPLQNLSNLTGMSVPQVSNVLGGKVDARVGTVEALADAMGARLVLVPKKVVVVAVPQEILQMIMVLCT